MTRLQMDDVALVRKLMTDAQHDPIAGDAREALCRALVSAFREAGSLLWMGGFLIGPDRVEGRSPFRFGSDSTVGLAMVAQIAGELVGGTVQLLESANSYAACALLRQVVEVEYLAWAFAEDEVEAAAWLRATREDRQPFWQPRHLRDRSKGRFRAADYGRHCEIGGHPSPEARVLLPDHNEQLPTAWWWLELATHALSTWEYVLEGAVRTGYSEPVRSVASRHDIGKMADSWRELDRLAFIARQAISGRPATDS